MLNEFSKKEAPIQGLAGMGGGVPSRLFSAASGITVDEVFSVDLYSPSASTTTVNNGIDFAGEGGMVFRKRRDATQNWSIHDTERGDDKILYPNLTTSEGTSNNILTSGGFTSTGLVWDTGGHGGNVVNFSFRKCPKFFDIVTYTGDGTTNRNISHDLGSVPGMIIVKGRNFGSDPWYTFHRSTGNQGELRWSETDSVVTGSSRWASFTPTSSHFRGDGSALTNVNVDESGTETLYVYGDYTDNNGCVSSITENDYIITDRIYPLFSVSDSIVCESEIVSFSCLFSLEFM
jgi:hypothetical protein